MATAQEITGNIFATILTIIVFISILLSIFNWLFRDGRGTGLYGGRGDFYMAD